MKIMTENCEKRGWGYCIVTPMSSFVLELTVSSNTPQYHGAISPKKRDEAITEFGNNPEKRILIASLKSGGLGLNLTMASKIACIDLWFDWCVEQQGMPQSID